MPLGFLLKAVQGCDYDTDELYKSQEHAAYIKNMCLDLNENASSPDGTMGEEGDNAGVFTPIESTEILCPMPLPEGDNYCIGYHESVETNEGYVFLYNSLSNHLVYVIDGATGRCQKVWQTPCLGFKLLPKHFISHGRCVLQTTCFYNKATGKEQRVKYLIFTDNQPPVKFISVTDAIATGGFSLPFFKNDNCTDCDLLSLGVSTPSSCIAIEPVVRTTQDLNLDNLINNKVFQWRIKGIDVWGRETEHGIISDPWYSTTGACIKESSGQSRCVKLTFDALCSTVTKLQVEYRSWTSNDPNLSVPTDWFLSDTLEKYDLSNPRLEWYQRPINPALNYNLATNQVTYTFCADKGTTAIAVEETNRNFNPVALQASGVFSINKSIGTVNHWRGFPPLDPSLLETIQFSVEKPDASTTCNPKPRTIVVYGYIRTLLEDFYAYIHVIDGEYVYGADRLKVLQEFGQGLPKGQAGFIGYFMGTSEYVISEQCLYDFKDKSLKVIGVDYAEPELKDRSIIILQRWTFTNTTPGKKIFRVASNSASASDPNYQKTSLPTLGTARLGTNFMNTNQYVHEDQFEIHIDQCEGDVDTLNTEILVIADLTKDDGSLNIGTAMYGYLYEDEVSKIPVEKAYISPPGHAYSPHFTDHNGFYWATSRRQGWTTNLYSVVKCSRGEMVAETEEGHGTAGSRVRVKDYYIYKLTNEYPHTDRLYIKGKVALCGTTTGVSGVLVMLTGGSYALSDENGNYTIIAHDSGWTEARTDYVKFAQVGLCNIGRCDNDCSTCFEDQLILAPPCTGVSDRVIPMATLFVKIRTIGLKGPQNGGHYELGIVPYYNIGQPAPVQRVPAHFLDIPTIAETGVFAFSRIKYSMPPQITFPLDVRYITIAISRNLNWDNFLTWIIEKREFVDNTGNVNNVNPSQVKIYYTSLAEYNVQNGFATTAVWQFLDEKQNPVVGDKVEFIVNGDGTFFPTRITALVKFDKAGGYILINYNEDLRNLKDGAQIKLLRPHVGTNSHFFFEQCRVIPIKNGKLANPADSSGYLNYFDSYMIPRQIPIPFYAIDPVTKLLTKDTTKSVLKTYTFPFEHHSPSDFWGAYAANRGRPHVVDPFQNRHCRSTEIAVSKALANDGVLNGLSYFSEIDFTEYDKQEWGSITCVISHIGSLTIICEQDNFEVSFDDNTLRVQKDNTLSFVPLAGRLGRPQRKKGDNYGCHPDDINTIREHKGLVMFLDRAEAALVVLYGDAQDVSVQGFKGYLKDKIKHMLQFNQSDPDYLKYFHASFDPKRNQYLLTSFKLPRAGKKLGIADYVNGSRERSLPLNETIGYNPFEKSLKLSYGFTPEYYGTLLGHLYDLQLLSFKAGQAWMHHKNASPQNKSFLNFYGVPCEAVYDVVFNQEPDSVKRYQWTEVLCREQIFFADRIITESGQRSRLLLTHWDKREDFFTADFKMDLNTYIDPNINALKDPNKVIYEGNPLSGKWIRVRYIARPEGEQGKYFEFDGVHVFIFVAQKSGTTATAQDFGTLRGTRQRLNSRQ